MENVLGQFRLAMQSRGLIPPDALAPDGVGEAPTDGNKRNGKAVASW
jgi:hypothetical protein